MPLGGGAALDVPRSRLTGQFKDKILEHSYTMYSLQHGLNHARVSMVSGIFLSGWVALLSYLLHQSHTSKLRLLEMVCPAILEVLSIAATFTRLRRYRYSYQAFTLTVSLALMVDVTATSQSPHTTLYALTIIPLFLYFIAGYSAQRLPFLPYFLFSTISTLFFIVYTAATHYYRNKIEMVLCAVAMLVFWLVVVGQAMATDKSSRNMWLLTENLKQEVTGLKAELGIVQEVKKQLDLQSPVEKIITMVHWIRNTALAGPGGFEEALPEVAGKCSLILSTLTNKMNLFSADIEKQIKGGEIDMDGETASYLLTNVAGKTTYTSSENLVERGMLLESIRTGAEAERISERPAVKLHLNTVTDWDFDVFALAAVTNNQPLRAIFDYVSQKYEFEMLLGSHSAALYDFIIALERLYNPTPYHNSVDSEFNPSQSQADRLILMQITMKVADISNLTRAPPLYTKWTKSVLEEFFAQGDEEKQRGLPVSPFMDRTCCDVAKSQKVFAEFVVVPLLTSYSKFIKGAEFLIQRATDNKGIWTSQVIQSNLITGEVTK
eukprot:m51a1_g13936 putative cgmp-inhibited 3 -cyclic phosphodiesterase b (550) ;mRNA; f:872093-874576